MKPIQLTIAIALSGVAFLRAGNAFSAPSIIAQEPTSEQILSACAASEADTLPIPFSDLEPNHWAFKAVMELSYCAPFSGEVDNRTSSQSKAEVVLIKILPNK